MVLLAEQVMEDRVLLARLSVAPLWVWCAWWGWEDKGVIVQNVNLEQLRWL